MNVGIENFNCKDVSEIIGVHYSTIVAWCRKGIMKSTDVSELGSSKPRYLITNDEVDRVKGLISKYGTRKWMLYNDVQKEKPVPEKIREPEEIVLNFDPQIIYHEEEDEQTDKSDFEMELIIANTTKLKAAQRRLAELDEERKKLMETIEDLRNDIIGRL